jgi:hypothetical protein
MHGSGDIVFIRNRIKRDIRGQEEGVGVMKDKELKIEET